MKIHDRVKIRDFVMTPEGYVRAAARLGRTGSQDYYGWELGKTGEGEADRLYKVHRPAEEVFAEDALKSFCLKPVTDGHPWDGVTAENWRKESVGLIAEDCRQDGEHLAATLLITDAAMANRIQREDGAELSCGYECELDWTSGTTPDGETYDAIQRRIRGNHVAVVEEGRCGPSCRVGSQADAATLADCAGATRCSCQRTSPTGDDTMKTVTIDGQSYQVAPEVAAELDQRAATIDTLNSKFADIKDTATELKDAKASIDRQLADKDARIADLEKQVKTADEIDALVNERVDVIADAKAIAPDIETAGKSAADIRREATLVAMGDGASLEGKSDDYVAAMFDHHVGAAKGGKGDAIVAAVKGKPVKQADARETSRKAYLDNLNRWAS